MATRVDTRFSGTEFSAEHVLEVHSCPECGIVHAIPQGLARYLHKYNSADYPHNYASVHCPAGHTWHFLGESEETRLRRRLEDARNAAARARAARDQAEASARGHKSAAKRARNERDRLAGRVKAGVCPCCNRTFKQLARHMKSQHPEYQPDQQ